MDITRAAVEKQSRFDGLCGIFCLVNAVRNWGESSFSPDDRDSLRYMIEAAERLNLFSSHRYMNGLEAHEMIDIFCEFSRAHRFPARAIHLSTMANALEKWSFSVQSKRIFEQAGQILLPVDSGRHWVLAYGYDFENARILVDDPDPDPNPENVKTNIASQGIWGGGRQGVLLLPNNCSLRFSE